jgi:NAD(P)-dependent dehydrogenase (short-subunit alcohol dehydrogenase family)
MTATNETGSYAGKVAFVTGAGSGMGRTTALAFAREGASLVLADVSDQGNQDTARIIDEFGGRALAVHCDVTRSEHVQAALNQAVGAFGRLDLALTWPPPPVLAPGSRARQPLLCCGPSAGSSE